MFYKITLTFTFDDKNYNLSKPNSYFHHLQYPFVATLEIFLVLFTIG